MKKIKLFLSLCMMCLCVAVLCMGILAVSSATYNINGNISYNMVDGVALVNTRVYKVAGTNSSLSTSCTTLSTMTFETIEQTSGYVLSQKLDTKATLSSGAISSEISAGSINISFGATDSSVYYYTFYIVINITNLTNAGALSATLSDNTTYASTISKVVNTSQMTIIKQGETKNIVIGLTIPNTTTDEIDIEVNYSLSISYNIYYTCTLDSTTIYFTKDMTWTEYVATLSDSNSFDVSGEYLLYNSNKIKINSTKVTPSDKIVDGGTYSLVPVGYGTCTVGTLTLTFELGTTWREFITANPSFGFEIKYWTKYDEYYIECANTGSGCYFELYMKSSGYVLADDTMINGQVYSSNDRSGAQGRDWHWVYYPIDSCKCPKFKYKTKSEKFALYLEYKVQNLHPSSWQKCEQRT